jgi:hypothetical protein
MIAGVTVLLAVSVFSGVRADAQAITSYSGTAVANEIDADDDGRTGYTATFQGRGPFGNHMARVHVEFAPWDGMSFCDPTSILLHLTVWTGAVTYGNGDQIYLELTDGTSCVNFVDGSSIEEVNLNITGGTGRFDGATGSVAASTRGQQLLGDPEPDARTAISAFSGTYVQDIDFPN